MGNDPIRIQKPTVVTPTSAALMHDQFNFDQAFHTVHYLLFLFVHVHQSITIMVCQVAKTEYKPFNSTMQLLYFCLGSLFVISWLRSGDVNFKMAVTLITAGVFVLLSRYVIEVIAEMCAILGIEVFTTKQQVLARRIKEKQMAEKSKATQSESQETKPSDSTCFKPLQKHFKVHSD